MKMVKHANVVNLLEVLASRSKIFIVLEYISGGELFDKIVEAGKFDEKQARYYFRQLVYGVKFCHDQGVCHRDLKPENLLLDQDDNLKISDFGLSAFSLSSGGETHTPVQQLLHTTCGTPNYVAPEVLADRGYDGKAADVWSIGVILYVLLAGFLPFDEPTMSGLFRKIQKGDFVFPPWFTPGAKKLIGQILVTDPKTRVDLLTITKDAWFNEGCEDEKPAAVPAPLIKLDSSDVRGAVAPVADMTAGSDAVDSPKYLNAFDLINLIGGLAFDYMLHYGDKPNSKKPTFMSNLPGKVIMEKLEAMIKADKAADVESLDIKTYVLKVAIKNKAAVTMNIQVYVILDSLHLVEITRGRGDIMVYHGYLESILPKMISQIGPDTKVGFQDKA